MVISVLISAFVFPFVGTICDLYAPKIIIPFSFLLRAMTTVLFYYLKSPNSYGAYIICILMIIATIIENISVDSIFVKNLPREIRAVLQGVYQTSGYIGIFIFSLCAGWFFDHWGPKSPFLLIGFLDFVYAFSVFLFSDKIFYKHDESS